MEAHALKSNEARKISHQSNGDLNKALQLIKNNGNEVLFEDLFVLWVRTAFKPKRTKRL